MSIIPLIIFVLFVLLLSQSLKVIGESQRGALFRLGRFVNIVGPGLVIIVPVTDRLIRVDLNEKIPGWQALGPMDLKTKVKEIALSEPYR